jgi:hypothetical protein
LNSSRGPPPTTDEYLKNQAAFTPTPELQAPARQKGKLSTMSNVSEDDGAENGLYEKTTEELKSLLGHMKPGTAAHWEIVGELFFRQMLDLGLIRPVKAVR